MGVNNTLILHKRNSYIPHSQLFLIAEKLKNKNFEVGTISAKDLNDSCASQLTICMHDKESLDSIDIKLYNCTEEVVKTFNDHETGYPIEREVTESYGVLSLVSDFNDISFDRLVQLRNYVMDFIDTTNEILF